MNIPPQPPTDQTPQQRYEQRIKRAHELHAMTIRIADVQLTADIDAAEIAYAREALEHDHGAGGES